VGTVQPPVLVTMTPVQLAVTAIVLSLKALVEPRVLSPGGAVVAIMPAVVGALQPVVLGVVSAV
jgi:hypothetical protein